MQPVTTPGEYRLVRAIAQRWNNPLVAAIDATTSHIATPYLENPRTPARSAIATNKALIRTRNRVVTLEERSGRYHRNHSANPPGHTNSSIRWRPIAISGNHRMSARGIM